jgi:hypothetical protein
LVKLSLCIEGYVTWAQVEEFCKRYDLKGSLNTFEFNEGQIYEKR